MRCSGCAAENAPDCRFCSECGARLVSICPSCRFENAPAAKFCGGCGARLTGAAAPGGPASDGMVYGRNSWDKFVIARFKPGQATIIPAGRQPRWSRLRTGLKSSSMSEYAERFVENHIDLSILPDLSDQHLKDLGIPLGDRLKMLRAIRELAGAVPAACLDRAKASRHR